MIPSEMTQADYARHRRVSRQRIGTLIRIKKIPSTALTKDKKIIVAAADLALGETIERVVARERDEDEGSDSAGADMSGAGSGLNKAKTALAFYQANLARLQSDERTGKLVARADLELAMHRAAEALGRDIDQIPARADDIATAYTRGGVDGVRAFLKQMARDIRTTISGNMRLLEQSESTPDAPDAPVIAEVQAA